MILFESKNEFLLLYFSLGLTCLCFAPGYLIFAYKLFVNKFFCCHNSISDFVANNGPRHFELLSIKCSSAFSCWSSSIL